MSEKSIFDREAVCAWLKVNTREGADMCIDSRKVESGDVFVALKGAKTDGLSYAGVAAARGASAMLLETRDEILPQTGHMKRLSVPELREHLGVIASDFYNNPTAKMTGIAITGTNGKTSISHWTSQMLSACGLSCAAIGTIGCFFEGKTLSAPSLTTPDAVSAQKLFHDLRQQGAQAFAIEASSIGLEQGRLSCTHFDVAVFTNLTRDHLDYHKTFEAYEAAKTILFDWPTLKCAVINLDDPVGVRLAKRTLQRGVSTIGYAIEKCNFTEKGLKTIIARNCRAQEDGMSFDLVFEGQTETVKVKALGLFNVSNLLAVAAVALSLGMGFKTVKEILSTLVPPKGRLEMVMRAGMPLCVVDYCHTPDAIEKALEALREVSIARMGKLWICLGAGGDRDPGKRPLMGEVAARKADRVIVTSDNPRTEDPQAIAESVFSGVRDKTKAKLVLDRAKAICCAVCEADASDVILVAGKGHEDYQEVMGVKHHFSDSEACESAFNERFEKKTGA